MTSEFGIALNRAIEISETTGKTKEFRRILNIVERLRTEKFNKSMWNRKSSMAVLDALEYEILTKRKY